MFIKVKISNFFVCLIKQKYAIRIFIDVRRAKDFVFITINIMWDNCHHCQ